MRSPSDDANKPAHGGARAGAGRPKGQGRWGEPCQRVSIPASRVAEVLDFLAASHDKRMAKVEAHLPELLRAADMALFSPDASARVFKLPLFGHRIAAGFPSPADDYVDQRLDLNDLAPSAIATRMLLALSDNASPISANLTGSSTASVAGTVVT